MTSTFIASFTLDTTDDTAPLGFEVWIDNQKFHDINHVTGPQKISMEIEDDEAEHELRLVMKNKTTDHTKVNESGNMTADARLRITDVAFDEISLGHMVTEQAVYEHDFNGTDQPTKDKFYGEMGCNGTVSLKFTSPIYLWLLEHM